MSSLVENMKAKLFIPFRELADYLSSEFPNVLAKPFSFPIGSLTELQGHNIGIDCILTDVQEGPDLVSLEVILAYLTTQPKINADVCWGSGQLEAEFFSDWQYTTDWPDVSDEVLETLYTDLPRLQQALVEAVKRRKPT